MPDYRREFRRDRLEAVQGIEDLKTKADLARFIRNEVEKPQTVPSTSSSIPSGIVMAYAGATAPAGWALCDGSALSRTTRVNLFNAIGTTYGAGDGSTTFNIPDLRGRVPIGVDGAAGRIASSDALGNSGGSETHTLTQAQLPSHQHGPGTLSTDTEAAHTHSLDIASFQAGSGGTISRAQSGGGAGVTGNGGAHSHDVTSGLTGVIGADGAHNNLQPYQVVNWIIKL